MTNKVDTTETRVRDVISRDCGLDDVKSTEHLVDDLGLDSLDLTELFMHIEFEFGLDPIPESVEDELRTVAQIVAYVDRRAR